MNKIKFNNHEYEVLNFSKNTYFSEDSISSSASCSIKTSDITSLYALADETISTLQIYHDNELIYNLTNVNGKLNSLDEYLSDDRVNINLNFSFAIGEEEEEENE